MKTITILKLDTPATLVESSMHVPQAEPVNFAKAVIDATKGMYNVQLLGLSEQSMEYGDSLISVIPYYGVPRKVKDTFDNTDLVIVWQGRHCIQIPEPTEPTIEANVPTMSEPYDANFFERLSLVKSWQIQMYNLISSGYAKDTPIYFLTTDARLPLLELNKIDSNLVPHPLPRGIKMLTQAHLANEFKAWHNKYGNGQFYTEMNIADYTYQFDEATDAKYLPLHCLPIWSHAKYYTEQSEKPEKTAICQVQSFKYMDDYRKKSLKTVLSRIDGNATLMGRFGNQERALIQYEYPAYSDKLLKNIKGGQQYALPFHTAARLLSDYASSICITDARYVRFGLCPNRVVEAIAVGSNPLLANGILDRCDDTLNYLFLENKLSYTYSTATEMLKSNLLDMLSEWLSNF